MKQENRQGDGFPFAQEETRAMPLRNIHTLHQPIHRGPSKLLAAAAFRKESLPKQNTPPAETRTVAKVLNKYWWRALFLCMLAIAIVVASLVTARKILQDRRAAARLLRNSDEQDEVRLARRLANLGDRQARRKDDESQDNKESDEGMS
jgi:hypothetical protein